MSRTDGRRPSTLDFSGSDDGTKAQPQTQGPYLVVRCTDGAEREGNRPGGGEDGGSESDIGAGFAVCHVYLRLQAEFCNSPTATV